MQKSERIGILGGTFNPPHCGHTYIAARAREALCLDRIIFVPAATPPHKPLPEGTPTAEQRIQMLYAATAALDFASVSDIETARGGKSYTIDTLRELHRLMPDAELYFIIGADMLLTFDQWRDFDKIFDLAHIAVFCRDKGQDARLEAKAHDFRERLGAKIELVRAEAVPVCSTQIRNELAAGIASDMLDPRVLQYIRERGLYHWNERLFSLRERVRGAVSSKRYAHILGCEKMAAALARRWGADELTARTAAVLHDMTRELPAQKQLKLCADYGIITDDILKMPEPLLHAITGAEVCRRELGVGEDVCSAIRWHTTAHAGMTLLEKIIYLADGIEPTRRYDGIHTLRRLAFSDLDAAVAQILRQLMDYGRQKGGTPARDTLDAYNFLCGDH